MTDSKSPWDKPRRPKAKDDREDRNVRAIAARAIRQVLRGRSLDDALLPAAKLNLPADAALVRLLSYGVLRELSTLQALSKMLMERPLDPDDEIACLILVGLFQLRTLKTPAHAATHETVEAAAALKRPEAQGFVNAVLRRYDRESETLEAQLPDDPVTRYAHPFWLVDTLKRDWPEDWEAVLAANNQQGPLTLRTNRRRITRDEYLKRLGEMQIDAQANPYASEAVTLETARGVDRIPGFNSGQVSVQDASAQFAAGLLDLKAGLSVLDACAAPGGKTAHILESADVRVTAVDSDGTRLIRVDENLRRLKLEAMLIAGDGNKPERWAKQRIFDRILLDAPCSGTGVIRRHPDIKWLRRETDIAALQQQQLGLLQALWPLLAPGGRLVYATCSILRAEGDAVIEQFSAMRPNAQVLPIDAEWGQATACGRRIAPGGAFDGFYYAVLQKR